MTQQLPSVSSQFSRVADYIIQHRFTSYLWGSFRSGPCQADVGVGQGSALSPVLSALYIAPVMKLYHMQAVALKTSLLSYVDDGTVMAQSKSLDENRETLKDAYAVLLCLFVAIGLVLEHSKTEYFIFDRFHSDYSPPIDLGYAPYTGENLLKPNLYCPVDEKVINRGSDTNRSALLRLQPCVFPPLHVWLRLRYPPSF